MRSFRQTFDTSQIKDGNTRRFQTAPVSFCYQGRSTSRDRGFAGRYQVIRIQARRASECTLLSLAQVHSLALRACIVIALLVVLDAFAILGFQGVFDGGGQIVFLINPAVACTLGPKTFSRRMPWIQFPRAPSLELSDDCFRSITGSRHNNVSVI